MTIEPYRGNTEAAVKTSDDGQSHVPVTASAPWVPRGFFGGQVGTSEAKTLAEIIGCPIPTGALAVWIQPENGSVRLRDDGVSPTKDEGFLVHREFRYAGDLHAVKLVAWDRPASWSPVQINLIFEG